MLAIHELSIGHATAMQGVQIRVQATLLDFASRRKTWAQRIEHVQELSLVFEKQSWFRYRQFLTS